MLDTPIYQLETHDGPRLFHKKYAPVQPVLASSRNWEHAKIHGLNKEEKITDEPR